MSLKNYETVFILTPVLTNEQIEANITKIRNFLLTKGAEILHETSIGLKKLAYPIQQKNTGIYHLIEFKADPTVIHSLEIAYKRDESIIRFLTFSLDKHAVAYNEKVRSTNLYNKVNLISKEEVTI